jgi:hypothetical protein
MRIIYHCMNIVERYLPNQSQHFAMLDFIAAIAEVRDSTPLSSINVM